MARRGALRGGAFAVEVHQSVQQATGPAGRYRALTGVPQADTGRARTAWIGAAGGPPRLPRPSRPRMVDRAPRAPLAERPPRGVRAPVPRAYHPPGVRRTGDGGPARRPRTAPREESGYGQPAAPRPVTGDDSGRAPRAGARLETGHAELIWSADGGAVTKRATLDFTDAVLGTGKRAFLNEWRVKQLSHPPPAPGAGPAAAGRRPAAAGPRLRGGRRRPASAPSSPPPSPRATSSPGLDLVRALGPYRPRPRGLRRLRLAPRLAVHRAEGLLDEAEAAALAPARSSAPLALRPRRHHSPQPAARAAQRTARAHRLGVGRALPPATTWPCSGSAWPTPRAPGRSWSPNSSRPSGAAPALGVPGAPHAPAHVARPAPPGPVVGPARGGAPAPPPRAREHVGPVGAACEQSLSPTASLA